MNKWEKKMAKEIRELKNKIKELKERIFRAFTVAEYMKRKLEGC